MQQDLVKLPDGFVFDRALAAAHVMEPTHTKGVSSFRSLTPPAIPAPALRKTLTPGKALDVDGFVHDLRAALDASTVGYVMQLRQRSQPLAAIQSNWAQRPTDGDEAWAQGVRMHIASVSKLVTAIAMTRALAAAGLPPTTKIIDYLPAYWSKGPNIDQITFGELMTHRSGFRVNGSDTFYTIMKNTVAGGVNAADIGTYSYQNMNFSLCRILISIVSGAVSKNLVFPPPFPQDQFWDFVTINAYKSYVDAHLLAPAGVSGPTFTHPAPDALAYNFPPASPWNSGDLTADCGGTSWHMSVDDLLAVMGCFRR
ncbi:MAG: beta-lactamase family protein, partial [Hyphomicrobiales bacterium]|nr:beta-lactamase family protein [Hyphomicrobiales bacterium]